ncbi:MAG TPA: hypothetical protein IAB84_06545 [Candidatus Choladousia intestinigallinarum]|nr:hypothetical protein [Candidatus Choladousia intestinigallinarum]
MGQIIKDGNAFYEIDDACFRRLNKRREEEDRKKNVGKGQGREKNENQKK